MFASRGRGGIYTVLLYNQQEKGEGFEIGSKRSSFLSYLPFPLLFPPVCFWAGLPPPQKKTQYSPNTILLIFLFFYMKPSAITLDQETKKCAKSRFYFDVEGERCRILFLKFLKVQTGRHTEEVSLSPTPSFFPPLSYYTLDVQKPAAKKEKGCRKRRIWERKRRQTTFSSSFLVRWGGGGGRQHKKQFADWKGEGERGQDDSSQTLGEQKHGDFITRD